MHDDFGNFVASKRLHLCSQLMQKKPELFQIPGHQAIFQIALETQDDDKVANQTDTLEQFQVALLRNTWSFECIESAADIQNDTRYTNTRAKLSEDQLNSTDEQRTLNPNIDSDSLMSDDSSGESQPIRIPTEDELIVAGTREMFAKGPHPGHMKIKKVASSASQT